MGFPRIANLPTLVLLDFSGGRRTAIPPHVCVREFSASDRSWLETET